MSSRKNRPTFDDDCFDSPALGCRGVGPDIGVKPGEVAEATAVNCVEDAMGWTFALKDGGVLTVRIAQSERRAVRPAVRRSPEDTQAVCRTVMHGWIHDPKKRPLHFHMDAHLISHRAFHRCCVEFNHDTQREAPLRKEYDEAVRQVRASGRPRTRAACGRNG